MSRRKLRVSETPAEKIASDLRGEVGEAVASWIMWRWVHHQLRGLKTGDFAADFADPDQVLLVLLSSRLHDDLVGRMAELAGRKTSRVNFRTASVKLAALNDDVDAFIRFVRANRFIEKRNYDVSHKELTASYDDSKFIRIEPPVMAKALAMSLRLVKKIDRIVLGPSAPFRWREMRRRRYTLTAPARIAYVMLPHWRLSDSDRVALANEEAR